MLYAGKQLQACMCSPAAGAWQLPGCNELKLVVCAAVRAGNNSEG